MTMYHIYIYILYNMIIYYIICYYICAYIISHICIYIYVYIYYIYTVCIVYNNLWWFHMSPISTFPVLFCPGTDRPDLDGAQGQNLQLQRAHRTISQRATGWWSLNACAESCESSTAKTLGMDSELCDSFRAKRGLARFNIKWRENKQWQTCMREVKTL